MLPLKFPHFWNKFTFSECQDMKFDIYIHTTCEMDIWDDNNILACKLGNKATLLCHALTSLLDMELPATKYN